MLAQQLDKWFSSVKKLLFKYKDGFYELPLIANSPEAIVKSLTKMPFVFHSAEKGIFSTNNPFIKAENKYHKINEDLWVIDSKAVYKENIFYKRISDNYLRADFNTLILEYSGSEINFKNALINGVAYSNCTWILLKHNGGVTNCRFKGDNTRSVIVYFTDQWLKDVLYNKEIFINSSIKDFFKSDIRFVFWPEAMERAVVLSNIFTRIFNKKIEQGEINSEEWNEFVLEFISYFINKYNEDEIGNNLLEISSIDRKKILETENLLTENLFEPFLGIDQLAKKIGLSPTKLKRNFKLVFGETIFRYFRNKQLEAARVLLQQKKEVCIKEIALQFGYNNPSKFTSAYKNYFGTLPSENRIA